MYINTSKIITYIIIFLLSVSFIDAVFQQIQLLLSTPGFIGGNSAFKILLLAFSLLVFIYIDRLKVKKLFYLYLIVLAYVIIDLAFMILSYKIEISDLALSIFTYYFFIIVAMLLQLIPNDRRLNLNIKIFTIIYMLILSIGIFQGIMNMPLLFLNGPDDSFKINSWEFYNKVRSFSLFTSPANFGHYISIATVTIIVYAKERKKYYAVITTFILGSIGTYFTLTRATYIEFTLTILTLLLLYSTKKYNSMIKRIFFYILPLLYTIGILVYTLYGSVAVNYANNYNILSDDTLNLRTTAWREYWELYTSGSISQIIFGSGYVQNEQSLVFLGSPIDNLFLAIILNIGLIGLILFLSVYIASWTYIIKKTNKSDYNFYAIYAYWSSFIATSIFGVNTNNYMIALAFILLLQYKKYNIRRYDSHV